MTKPNNMISFIKRYFSLIGIIYVYRGDPENKARELDVSIRATVNNTKKELITEVKTEKHLSFSRDTGPFFSQK